MIWYDMFVVGHSYWIWKDCSKQCCQNIERLDGIKRQNCEGMLWMGYGMIWYALGVKQSVGLSTRHSLDPSFSLSWSLGGTGRPQLFGRQGGFLVHDNVVIAVEVDLEASVVAVLDNGHAGSKLRVWFPHNIFTSITLQ